MLCRFGCFWGTSIVTEGEGTFPFLPISGFISVKFPYQQMSALFLQFSSSSKITRLFRQRNAICFLLNLIKLNKTIVKIHVEFPNHICPIFCLNIGSLQSVHLTKSVGNIRVVTSLLECCQHFRSDVICLIRMLLELMGLCYENVQPKSSSK